MLPDLPPTGDVPSLHDQHSDAGVPLSPSTEAELADLERDMSDAFKTADSLPADERAAMHAAFGYDEPLHYSEAELDAMFVTMMERRDAEKAIENAAAERQEIPATPQPPSVPTTRHRVWTRDSHETLCIVIEGEPLIVLRRCFLRRGYVELSNRIAHAVNESWRSIDANTPGTGKAFCEFRRDELNELCRAATTTAWMDAKPIPVLQPLTCEVYKLDPAKWKR